MTVHRYIAKDLLKLLGSEVSAALLYKFRKKLNTMRLGTEWHMPLITSLQGVKVYIKKFPKEADEALNAVITRIIETWTGASENSQELLDIKPILDLLKKRKVPSVIPDPKYKIVYRGTDISGPRRNKLANFIRKTNLTDWTLTNLDGARFYVYTKKSFPYKPHKKCQSWTVSAGIAEDFSSMCIMVTKINNDFYFNHKIINKIADMHEDEIIHFGANLKVFVTVSADDFTRLLPEKDVKQYSTVLGKSIK